VTPRIQLNTQHHPNGRCGCADLEREHERDTPLQHKSSRRLRDVLIVSSTGIALGYVTPTLVDLLSAIMHALVFVVVVGICGWALLIVELLDSLGVF
jgi:hypothetical protein